MKVPDHIVAAKASRAQLTEQEEFDLIRAIVQGQRELFHYFVERYQRMILSLIWRQLGDAPLTQDLAQEVFLKAYSALKTFRFESSFRTWIVRITLNHTRSHFSSKQHLTTLKETETDETSIHTLRLVSNPEEQLLDSQRMTHFRAALQNLPHHYRETLVLVALEGKDYEEAAKILEVPIGTIRSRMHQARKLLKQALEAL